MAQYPRCPHCNTILPEFGPKEKKICPNCERRIYRSNDPKESTGSIFRNLFKACWIWILLLLVIFVFSIPSSGIEDACISLLLEASLAYIIFTATRNRILRTHLQDKLTLSNDRKRELQVRKGQLRYYRNCAITYFILTIALFIVCCFCINGLQLPEDADLPGWTGLLFCPMLLTAFMCCWNLLMIFVRGITLYQKLPADDACRHRSIPEPFK